MRQSNITLEYIKLLEITNYDTAVLFSRPDLYHLYTGFDDIDHWIKYQVSYKFLMYPQITKENLHQLLDHILSRGIHKYIFSTDQDFDTQDIFTYMIRNPNLRYQHLKKIIKYMYIASYSSVLLENLKRDLKYLFEIPYIPNNKIFKCIFDLH
jgi:hypothetical protein